MFRNFLKTKKSFYLLIFMVFVALRFIPKRSFNLSFASCKKIENKNNQFIDLQKIQEVGRKILDEIAGIEGLKFNFDKFNKNIDECYETLKCDLIELDYFLKNGIYFDKKGVKLDIDFDCFKKKLFSKFNNLLKCNYSIDNAYERIYNFKIFKDEKLYENKIKDQSSRGFDYEILCSLDSLFDNVLCDLGLLKKSKQEVSSFLNANFEKLYALLYLKYIESGVSEILFSVDLVSSGIVK